MKREKEEKLPFLNVLVMKRHNRRLAHRVFRKPTHTHRYLHLDFIHYLGQKRAARKSFIDRALQSCKPNFLGDELKHLDTALQASRYSVTEIRRAMRRAHRPISGEEQKGIGKAFLSYMNRVMDRIGKLLRRYGV